jgi:hypothetical protein
MKIRGVMTKDGSFWAVDVPMIGVTQGRSKADSLRMAVALVRDLADDQKARIEATADDRGSGFTLRGDPAVLVPLILRQRRTSLGLTLRDMAERLGSKSPISFARYERGETMPTVDQLDRLLHALGALDEVCVA